MPATSRRSARRVGVAVLAALGAQVAWEVVAATPAAAHAVGGGALPVPPWLLGYGGAAVAGLTAVGLRAVPRPGTDRPHAPLGPTGPAAGLPAPAGPARAAGPLRWVGLALYLAVTALALGGPDTPAANIAAPAVLAVFWVGLPLACLAAGDVFARINPFDPLVAGVQRLAGLDRPRVAAPPPAWTGAAFLALFVWFPLAYHRPESPRALGVLLVAYGVLATTGGFLWGRRWLRAGEAFGALSAGIAWLRRPGRPAPPGVAALAVVWLGGTAFDAVGSTGFWLDVLGTNRGWTRTVLDTVGLVWVLAMVASVALLAARLVGRALPDAPGDPGSSDAPGSPATAVPLPLAAGLLAVAATWFVIHDFTLLLFDGQNFLLLLSDPVGRGWNLFGDAIDRRLDFGVVQSTWVAWVHIVALLGGHALAVAATHRMAVAAGLRARAVAAVTWAGGALAAAGAVVAALLIFE